MKTTMTKLMLLAALVGAATASANAGVRFNVDLVVPAPVIVTPVVTTVYPPAPAPIVEVAPVCPGVGYVWAPGYWTFRDHAYVWVRGAWNYRPVRWGQDHDRGHDFDRGHDHAYDRDHGYGFRR
jgi:hypothetical protein